MRKLKSRASEKANIEKRQQAERASQENRPHVVLGHRPGDEAKWQNCDLARVIVTEADILASPMPPASPSNSEGTQVPSYFNYGIREREEEMLFSVLPSLTIQGDALLRHRRREKSGEEERFDLGEMQETDLRQRYKAQLLARLVDLRNANAQGIAYENRMRIIAEFSEPENPTDSGRPEVQAALLTLRIRALWDHLTRFKKDLDSRRSIRRLIHQRARILKYLKKVNQDRYERVLDRLGLEPESVEGELVI